MKKNITNKSFSAFLYAFSTNNNGPETFQGVISHQKYVKQQIKSLKLRKGVGLGNQLDVNGFTKPISI